MKIAGFILLGAVVIAAVLVIWLAWMNRASEKMIVAIIPAVVALIGAPLIVLVFGGEPPILAVFPAAFLYQLDNRMPPNLPWALIYRRFSPSLSAPAELHKKYPELFSDVKDELGVELYHHLLQKSLIDWMTYKGGWQIERIRFELPGGREERSASVPDATGPSRIFSRQEIQDLLGGNKFAGVWVAVGDRLVLPPNTRFRVTAPHGKGSVGEIRFENSFCRISIETQFSTWIRSLGMYRFLAGISVEESRKFATATYVVRVRASFSRLRPGHPEMQKYRSWARELADGLRDQFDEQVIWQRTRDDFLLHKQLGITERDGI